MPDPTHVYVIVEHCYGSHETLGVALDFARAVKWVEERYGPIQGWVREPDPVGNLTYYYPLGGSKTSDVWLEEVRVV